MFRTQITQNLHLSTIIQGLGRLNEWKYSIKELAYFMKQCVERGVTTFDTAEIYCKSTCESMIGEALRRDPTLKKQIEIVTKTGISRLGEFKYYDTTYNRIMDSCKNSLMKLGIDKLDLYLLHREDPCMDVWEITRAFKELKKCGLVKEVGVSNFDPCRFEALNQAMEGELVTNQIEWNPICLEHFNSGMIDLLASKKLHPMVWSPLSGGTLLSSIEEPYLKCRNAILNVAKYYEVDISTIIYAWILYHPVGALPISGSGRIKRLDNAVKALNLRLEHHDWYKIYTSSGQIQLL